MKTEWEVFYSDMLNYSEGSEIILESKFKDIELIEKYISSFKPSNREITN
jgi:hypothetical protein